MDMYFTKMQGCGNDYIYVDGAKEHITQAEKPDIVRRLSDRHFGIGGDGVIFINPAVDADFEMEMYNADGSRSEMCGNGIRCVAKYVYDKGLTDKTDLVIVSGGKPKYIHIHEKNGKAERIRVNMGSPILEPKLVPVDPSKLDEAPNAGSEALVNTPLTVLGKTYGMTFVSMGNPHAVTFVDDVKGLDLPAIGPSFENHVCFPNRTNTEFVRVMDRKNIEMRVWERGTGETLACGTGCCACGVACVLNGLTDESITVHVLGGEIEITWDRGENVVYMTGPAVTVFEGEVKI